jgi:hypothetical protein
MMESNKDKLSYNVVSSSSSHDVHKEENVTNKDKYRYWQTAQAAKNAYIEVKFSKPSKIEHLEISNKLSNVIIGSVNVELSKLGIGFH